jgi:3-oxoadipate enol-lactonase
MLIDVDGARIHLDVLGPTEAPTVCMVHGLTLDSGMWSEQVPALLMHGYRVLRIDLFGHGGTPPLSGPYTLSQLARMVAGVIHRVAPAGAVDYVGLSIGGMIGQTLALEHPDVIRSALWSDTRAGYDEGEADGWPPAMRLASEAGTLAPMVDEYLLYSVTPQFIGTKPLADSALRSTMLNTTVEGFLGCSEAIKSFDDRPLLGRVRAPVLVICGSEDEGTPRRRTVP